MNTRMFAFLSVIGMAGAAACGGDDGDGGVDTPDADVNSDTIAVTDDVGADESWTADNTYVLETNVFVRNATLTIEPGTVIMGEANTSLVITSTAKINAAGTATAPIVFTSAQPQGSRSAGDWGGVVLLGSAPINVAGGTDSIEGFPAGTAGTEFGGSAANHDCGVINYARIEFAGFELSTDNELNGLTVGACGSATDLDFIQVHQGADDGIEFFGGTADLKHAVITQPDDDGLDWDFGWSGKVQFIIVQQNAVVGNRAFESDNNKNNNDATPRSAPTIYNATLIGSDSEPGAAGKAQGGMMLRRGTAGEMHNFVIAHFTDFAVDIADVATVQQANANNLVIMNSYFFDNANDINQGWPEDFDVKDGQENDCTTPGVACADGFDEAGFFGDSSMNNTFADPKLESARDLFAPSFAPTSGSPVLSGGATPPSGFDPSATFIGAIGADDWTAGWTAYPAN